MNTSRRIPQTTAPAPPRRRGERAGLTTQAVVDTARRIVQDSGLPALSLRAVARELGVVPNALYAHVKSKDDLLDLVLDDVLGEVVGEVVGERLPETSRDHPGENIGQAGDSNGSSDPTPLETVRSVFLATYDALVRHPAIVPGYLSRQGSRGPHAIALGRVTEDALLALGVTPGRVPEVRRALIVQVIGFAAFATATQAGYPERARANYADALDWILSGATAAHSDDTVAAAPEGDTTADAPAVAADAIDDAPDRRTSRGLAPNQR